jgi:ABC-2 type transport system ATP-binding protein
MIQATYPLAFMSAAVAIRVDRVSKSFRLPVRRVDTLRERLVAGLRPVEEKMTVLNDVSFDVRQGEFFGIVGRNGSGKSTLLKMIAGIYRPDTGRISAKGRLAPIIELGVGFNQDLPAYDNVVMNAVMMGLTPTEARARFEKIMDFSELSEFEYLKLKNYSSGMNARLAFSIMVHVDADLLLFDEVLAVGDARFQQKCTEVFHDMRGSGRTGILVTHAMPAMELLCDRAMLLEDGEVRAIGTPREVAAEYEELAKTRANPTSASGPSLPTAKAL